MRRTSAFLLPLVVLGISAFVLAAYRGVAGKPAATAVGRPVRVVAAVQAEWPRLVSVPGTVSAVDTATLASRDGGQVTTVKVDAGTHVAQGALLAEVGAVDARGQLAQAQARLATAHAAFDQAAADERRYANLYRTRVTSAQQYGAARRTFLSAKAEVAAATSALAAAKSNLKYAEIRAPFTGMIVEKDVKPGDFTTPGAILFVMAGDTPEIRTHVGLAIYGALTVGETADVVIGGKPRPAVLTRVVAAADPQTRTHLVELHLQGATAAPYGAYAEVQLTLGRAPVLTVPTAALSRRAGLLGVFVVNSDHRAHFRLVRTGQRRDGRVAIVAGLAAGEKVIVTPAPDLINDSPVTLEAAAPAAVG